MLNPVRPASRNYHKWLRYVFMLAGIAFVTLIVPKKGKFRYDFERAKPWQHVDMVAPFDFAIRKSPQEIETEKKDIRGSFKPYYQRLDQVPEKKKNDFHNIFSASAAEEEGIGRSQKMYLDKQGERILEDIYNTGVLNPALSYPHSGENIVVQELYKNEATDKQLSNYYTLEEAKQLINERTEADTLMGKPAFIRGLLGALDYNIVYDSALSNKSLNGQLSEVSPSRGMVKEGDKLISRGNIVTSERYQVLSSLKEEYESQLSKGVSGYLFTAGYLILISLLFIVFGANLEVSSKDLLNQPKSMLSILGLVMLFTGLTASFVVNDVLNVYLLPYCVVPVVLLAFFGQRVALATHFLIVFLCGLMLGNPYEFVLIQTLTGFVAVLAMLRIRYISQFFVATMLIFMTYCILYFGVSMLHASRLQEIPWEDFLWFGGNFILSLLAYPLIYANEKIFGFLSDISLLELSDINNKIMKELSVKAPGTFQHSLQVANLAEAVIDRIGGNALLARVGALYHDIGKIYNPTFFIENQSFMDNPHTDLTDEQSAAIIIQHVTKGAELAQENHLPEKVIDFIRTHHGTTRVEYFYQHHLKEHPEINVDETIFRYPGPKPTSKEMAVVMIVDSVEAASRSIKNPDERQIDTLVDKIVDHKLQDHQFDLATITIQELNTTRRLLKKLLKSINHIRIIYPSQEEEKKNSQ